MKPYFLSFALAFLLALQGFAQEEKPDKTAVTFEELYDEPYAINKLFIGFVPLYAEVFATNTTAGFGGDAHYYYRDKFDIKASFRRTYGASFFDYNYDNAQKNSNVETKPVSFAYYEIGGTYHIKDWESSSKTKMTLYKNSYKGNKWASRVPLQTQVPAKVRRIYGGRLGAMVWSGTTNLNRALDKQGLANGDLVTDTGEPLPSEYTNQQTNQVEVFNVFSNVRSAAIYIGGSMSRIHNIAVTFDNYEGGLDDGILTLYADIIYAPMLKVDNVEYNSKTYSTAAVKTNPIGFRLGMDGKYNRTLSWGYGGELGYRPSVKGRCFYTMFRITFPMFGTNLDNKVESFSK